MSVIREFHLGPYAEYLVRADRFTDAFMDMVSDLLRINWGVSRPPEVTRDGMVYHRTCLMPNGSKPGEAAREFSFDDGVWGIQDLRGLDSQAEIDWFTRSYQAELAKVTAHVGRDPTIHWGIVGWIS